MKNFYFPENVITDKDFYYMIENQIRATMPLYEEGIALSVAESLLNECGISSSELNDFPIEGYYYKSNALKKYFTIIRNLQHNVSIFSKIKDTDNLRFLQALTYNKIWGEENGNTCSDSDSYKSFKQKRDEIKEKQMMGMFPMSRNDYMAQFFNAPYNQYNPPLIRLYDILSLTMNDTEIFNTFDSRTWSIEKIKNNLHKHFKNRPNLVELAYLTGETECLLCGAETNSLYRMYGVMSGCSIDRTIYRWNVSPKMEELATYLIDSYNRLIGSEMKVPTIYNFLLFKREPEYPRVALMGKILATGENYFWILDKDRKISEQYTTEFLTTEMYMPKMNENYSIYNKI